jgi:hypothetical protein
MSLLECCVKPTKENDFILLNRYEQFFYAPDVQIIDLTIPVIHTATQLRAKYGLRTVMLYKLLVRHISQKKVYLSQPIRNYQDENDITIMRSYNCFYIHK